MTLTAPGRWARRLLPALLALAAATASAAAPHAGHWIARWPGAEAIRLDAAAVLAHGQGMLAKDPSLVDLAALPDTLPQAEVAAMAERLGRTPEAPRFDASGERIAAAQWAAWQAARALDALPEPVPLRFALVTRRAALRALPTMAAAFSNPGDTDIDRLQESALFPGTPVAILHASRDGRWAFVQAETYAAWIETDAVAEGPREVVLDYAARASRTITGASAALVVAPEAPSLSGLRLDMGVALPERQDLPARTPVNGQAALAAHIVELPLREADGRLRIAPALLPFAADSHDGPLPASRANVLRQAFKFLGERYGWGHANAARDCSGFVSEVYRSLGFRLPRNADDQENSPMLDREPLAGLDREARLAAIARLAPGDLIYLPGHVVMLVGHDERGPWVIHDVHRLRERQADGRLRETPANGVVLTPLLALAFDETRDYLDAASTLVRVLPRDEAQ